MVNNSPLLLKLNSLCIIKRFKLVTIMGGILLLNFPGIAQVTYGKNSIMAESLITQELIPKQTPTEKKIIYFGLKKFIEPVSYQNSQGFWGGYCKDFLDDLEEYINNDDDINQKVEIQREEVSYKNRFHGEADNGTILHGECGADTIKEKRFPKGVNGEFSQPFAWTGAKLLIREDKVKYFYEKIPFKDKKIGFLSPQNTDNDSEGKKELENNATTTDRTNTTTTDSLIQSIYPQAKFTSVNDRTEAIMMLKEGVIDAYATDEIILKSTLKFLKEELKKEKVNYNFYILPRMGKLSYEQYGIVIYENDFIDINYINEFLNTAKAQEIANKNFNNESLLVKLLELFYLSLYRYTWGILVIIFMLFFLSSPVFLFLFFKIAPTSFLQKIRKINKTLFARFTHDDNKVALTFLTLIHNEIFYTIMSIANKEVKAENYQTEENTMSNSQNNDFSGANIEGIGNIGENIGTAIGNQTNYTSNQNLAEAAAEIQQLLERLSQAYPTETLSQQALVAEKAINQIENDPTLKERVVSAIKGMGVEALMEAIDHPVANVLRAGIEAFKEPSGN